MGLNLSWPSKLRNVYPALGLFILLTWIELGFDVTSSGTTTAILGFGMLFLAIICAILFEKRSFCRYLCPVGRISGIYALFSPLELRAKSATVCADCSSKDCLMGNSQHRGCPMFLNPATLRENTYCTLCTECVRTCPSQNISLAVRPFATDLFAKNRFRMDEAVLIVTLLALTSFHGITMTPYWTRVNQLIRVETGLEATVIFTLLMGMILFGQVALFWLGSRWSSRLAPNGLSVSKIFKAFSYCVLPIALFYHLAHNSMHFFMEAQELIPLLSDPFGLGWNLFGTAGNSYRELLTIEIVSWIQVLLILSGHLFGVRIADRISRRLVADPNKAMLMLAPLIFVMILYSALSIFLIASPMEMRTGF
jgi:ferredoxin